MHFPVSRAIRAPVSAFCARLFNSKVVLDEILKNPEAVKHNLRMRKNKIDVDRVVRLANTDASSEELANLLKQLPNSTHPSVANASTPIELEQVGEKAASCKHMVEASVGYGVLLRGKSYTITCGDRTYFLTGDLARLERALVRFTLERLKKHNFKIVSVPDIFSADQIENCGMRARGQRSQIYHIKMANLKNMCLAGTAEIALANMFREKSFDEGELPLKLCAVSRCFRGEVSTLKEEKGLYRVHQFTKVEMFAFTEGNLDASQKLQKEFVEIEKSLFVELGLHFKVMDMPPIDLGKPAFRKFDIETWMPGHKFYGEISSTSDCTNYQSNRLGINYRGNPVHTVNGTACAIPRMLIALGETHTEKGAIFIPEVLRQYMGGVDAIRLQPSFKKWKKMPYFFFENREYSKDENNDSFDEPRRQTS